jgi:hypothetical protein
VSKRRRLLIALCRSWPEHHRAYVRKLFHIKPVRSAAGLQATVQLFNAYASSLTVDLANQDFATEIATLPGKCAVPTAVRLSVRLRPVESE